MAQLVVAPDFTVFPCGPLGAWEGGLPMFGPAVTRVGWQVGGEVWEVPEESRVVAEGHEGEEKRADSVMGLKSLDTIEEESAEEGSDEDWGDEHLSASM